MSKSDKKFVNTSQEHELEDWLYRNDFSTKQSNVDKLKNIINDKVKQGNSSDNITWEELDSALTEHPEWFTDLDNIGK